jgi:hypothetical protein
MWTALSRVPRSHESKERLGKFCALPHRIHTICNTVPRNVLTNIFCINSFHRVTQELLSETYLNLRLERPLSLSTLIKVRNLKNSRYKTYLLPFSGSRLLRRQTGGQKEEHHNALRLTVKYDNKLKILVFGDTTSCRLVNRRFEKLAHFIFRV